MFKVFDVCRVCKKEVYGFPGLASWSHLDPDDDLGHDALVPHPPQFPAPRPVGVDPLVTSLPPRTWGRPGRW